MAMAVDVLGCLKAGWVTNRQPLGAPLPMRQMTRLNSRNDLIVMTAVKISSYVLLLLLLTA